MKKRFAVLLVIGVIILSGAAGFGGTYLAKNLIYAPPAVYTESSAPALAADNSGDRAALFPGQSGDNSANVNESQPAEVPGATPAETPAIASSEPPAMTPAVLPDESTVQAGGDKSALFGTSLVSKPDDNTAAGALTIPEIAKLTADSVVEIYTETVSGSGRMGQFVTQGAGSGVIITSDGYIITNNHVIDGARKITVRLTNGIEYDAALVGHDSKADLAVLKIKASGLQPATYGNSDKLVVGELAVAIGNPLGQLGGTVTEGIISALSRSIDIDGEMMTLLQTTAAVNPGNSGGGLFNSHGELVGVVNSKSSGSGIEGLGFAIPANTVKPIIDALIQYGYVPGRIDFGATLIDISDAWSAMMYRVQSTGVYVSQADADSTLQSGDRIVSIDGKEVQSSSDVKAIIDTHKVGDVLSISITRNGQNTTVQLKLKQLTT